ncbi:DUF6861 domain-containing protein [Pseudomonas sp. dw_358]|uniref:DUF6861 domain-containing protein n=1 Tax=Pseudomonas sp. dw_358 TaxID=2720083 RepID=UPI001BD663E1|nr:polymorphic toxin type 28 domain-containing protein [Pseudomonas sp. dw_358]
MNYEIPVANWGEIERDLNHNAVQIGQMLARIDDDASLGWQGGWSGLSHRIHDGLDHIYNRLGGRRVACLREALEESYPLARHILIQQLKGIEISQVVDVLLDLTKQVAMVMSASIAAGALGGAAVGSLAGGVGALPGGVAGSLAGGHLGGWMLSAMGLSGLASYLVVGGTAWTGLLFEGITMAWRAPDKDMSPGTDPTGGAAAREHRFVQQAAHKLAQAQEQMVIWLLTAVVSYLSRGSIKNSLVGMADQVQMQSALLLAEVKNKQFAAWLTKNQHSLLEVRALNATKAPYNISPEEWRSLGSSTLKSAPPATEGGTGGGLVLPRAQLSQGQLRAISKIDKILKGFKDSDIEGALKDMAGHPVPKANGGYWDHMKEMSDILRGLRNHAQTLKGLSEPVAVNARHQALATIRRIESALNGAGI